MLTAATRVARDLDGSATAGSAASGGRVDGPPREAHQRLRWRLARLAFSPVAFALLALGLLLFVSPAAARTELLDHAGKLEPGACATFTADGKAAALALGQGVRLFDLETGVRDRVLPLAQSAAACAFTADGKSFAIVTSGGDVVAFDAASGQPKGGKQLIMNGASSVGLAALGVAGQELLVVTAVGYFVVSVEGVPRLSYAQALPPGTTSYAGGPTAAAFSPDGTVLLVSYDGGRFELFDVRKPERPALLAHGDLGSTARSLALAPSGKRLAALVENARVVVWDLEANKAVFERRGRGHFSFSPSGRELLVRGLEEPPVTRVLDAESGSELGRSTGTRTAFAAGGQHVLAVDQRKHGGLERTVVWLDAWTPPTRQADQLASEGPREPGHALQAGSPSRPTADNYSLELFGVELETATRAELSAAILKAGGVLTSAQAGGADIYDVKALGLPAISRLEVLYQGDRFLIATYSGKDTKAADERLRQMLAGKYGLPFDAPENRTQVEKLTRRDTSFTKQYGGAGRRVWPFANGMRLVYKRSFFDAVTLTYVDQPRFDATLDRAKKAAEDEARRDAAEKKNMF